MRCGKFGIAAARSSTGSCCSLCLEAREVAASAGCDSLALLGSALCTVLCHLKLPDATARASVQDDTRSVLACPSVIIAAGHSGTGRVGLVSGRCSQRVAACALRASGLELSRSQEVLRGGLGHLGFSALWLQRTGASKARCIAVVACSIQSNRLPRHGEASS